MTALSRLYIFVVLAILSAPIVVVAGVSLNERKSLYFPPRGVSVAWYEQLFTDPSWRGALINSLTIAVFSAIFAVMVALPLAYAIWRYRLRFGALLYTIGLSPFQATTVSSAMTSGRPSAVPLPAASMPHAAGEPSLPTFVIGIR